MAGSWSVFVLFRKEVETKVHEVTLIQASLTSTEANFVDAIPTTTPPFEASPQLDPWSRRREINLGYFECRVLPDGYFCFSSDSNFCIHGFGVIPQRKVIVQKLAQHSYTFCKGKPIMEVVRLAAIA